MKSNPRQRPSQSHPAQVVRPRTTEEGHQQIRAEIPARQQSGEQPPVPITSQAATCPLCDGIGWVTHDVPVGHPDFGKAFPCRCSEAAIISKRIERLIGENHVLDAYRGLTFETFIERAGSMHGKEAGFAFAQQFAAGQPPTNADGLALPGLYFYGAYGVGKTGLAALALFGRAARGESCACIDWRRFISQVQDSYRHHRDPKAPSRETILSALADVPVLLIDELGSLSAPTSSDRTEITEELIRARHARRRPTLITSNIPPNKLAEHFSPYLPERVFELCHAVAVTGVSLRF